MRTLYKIINACLLTLLSVLVFPMMLNAQADTCQHEIYMMDDFGDGWNGCSLDLFIDGVMLLDSVTLSDTVLSGSIYFDAPHGAEIATVFYCHNWCFECSYEIVGPLGNILGSDGMGGVVPVGIAPGICFADCLGTITSISEKDVVQLSLFPNPAKDKVNIESSSDILQLTLLDCSGRVMENFENIAHNQFCISVSQYQPGTYLLRIDTEQGRVVRKIVVKE